MPERVGPNPDSMKHCVLNFWMYDKLGPETPSQPPPKCVCLPMDVSKKKRKKKTLCYWNINVYIESICVDFFLFVRGPSLKTVCWRFTMVEFFFFPRPRQSRIPECGVLVSKSPKASVWLWSLLWASVILCSVQESKAQPAVEAMETTRGNSQWKMDAVDDFIDYEEIVVKQK